MPTINCLHCNNIHTIEQREINRGNGKFCSRKCANLYRVLNLAPLELNVKCSFCQKLFHMAESKKKNSKSGLYFCCRQHKDLAQRIGGISEIMPAHYNIVSENTYRRIAFASKAKICERCDYNEHEAGIVVHHIDRNRENNDIKNLEVLCAICHNIEHWGDVDKS